MTLRKTEFYNFPAECNQKGRKKVKEAQQWIRGSRSMAIAPSTRPSWEVAKWEEANSDYLHSSPHGSIHFPVLRRVSLLHWISQLSTPAKTAYNMVFPAFAFLPCFSCHSPKSIMPSFSPLSQFLLILQNYSNPFSNLPILRWSLNRSISPSFLTVSLANT